MRANKKDPTEKYMCMDCGEKFTAKRSEAQCPSCGWESEG